jgi:NAD dependent epimerase/dehydratase
MKKIFITGAGGFIGSHLAERCVQEGFHVKALVRYNSMNLWGWLNDSPLKSEMEIVSGDVRDFDLVNSAVKGCDVVFHLAALIGIPYSYVSPLAYIRTNIEGTYNILQAAREHKVKHVLVTSTSETYGSAQYVPIDERHPMVGQSPYAATKIAADQMAISYHRSFELPVKIVRPFNTFGPRQSARAVIPTIITQILSGKEDINLGNLEPTRDFTYVRDTVDGFLAIYRSKKLWGEVTNIGTGVEITIRDLVVMIADLLKKKVRVAEDTRRMRKKTSEVDRLCCHNGKIQDHTSWTPQYDLQKGLRETIQWIKRHQNLYKTGIYNV